MGDGNTILTTCRPNMRTIKGTSDKKFSKKIIDM